MFKRGQIITVALIVISIILYSITPVSAIKPSNNSNENPVEIIQNICDNVEFDVTATQLRGSEKVKVEKLLEKRLEVVGFSQKISNENFVEVSNKDLIPVKVSDNNSPLAEYVILKQYVNDNGETVLAMFVYDANINNLISVIAEKSNKDNVLESFFSFSEYNPNEPDNELENSGSEIGTMGFTFNGKSFACSMAGLVACSSYCIFWGLVNPLAGLTCEIACGTAMAAACATW